MVLSCATTQPMIELWVDGALDEMTSEKVRTHLLICPCCEELLRQEQVFRSLLQLACGNETVAPLALRLRILDWIRQDPCPENPTRTDTKRSCG